MDNLSFMLVATVHVITSIILITFVLLQNPKGGALGILGGQSSSKSVFSTTGASNFLTRVTKWCIVIFSLTSIQLTYMTSRKDKSLILDQVPASTSPTQSPVSKDINNTSNKKANSSPSQTSKESKK